MLRVLSFLLTCAMLVAPNRHAELQRASRVAMTCPDIAPGRYVVEVTTGGAGSGARAHLISSPALRASTVRCIELAFATQRYALVRGTEVIEHPFVLLDGGP
jgi:hypothetical protein